MGRYYSGDIEGKFWFGIQASEDPEFFEPEYTANIIQWEFLKENIENVEEKIDECNTNLGFYGEMLDNFFENKDYYSDSELAKILDVTIPFLKHILEWYARKELGLKILDKLKKDGKCVFETGDF